jgi:hypothetical protein
MTNLTFATCASCGHTAPLPRVSCKLLAGKMLACSKCGQRQRLGDKPNGYKRSGKKFEPHDPSASALADRDRQIMDLKTANQIISAELDRQIKNLKKANEGLSAEVRSLREQLKKTGVVADGMNFETRSKITKALNHDRAPTEAERLEGCKAFNAWCDSFKRRR